MSKNKLSFRLSEGAANMQQNAIRNLLSLLENPNILSFAGGIPDPNLFPRQEIAEISKQVLQSSKPDSLQYGMTAGTPQLREMVAERMTKRGMRCTAENIIMTTGSQQAVDLCTRILSMPGEKILVEDPTYLGALQTFKSHGQQLSILTDDMSSPSPTSFAYVVPDHANPTGISMPIEKRMQLLKSSHENNFVIIEDAAYQELSYYEAPLPTLLSLDCASTGSIEDSRVIYCGSFSKTMAPALRIGWACAPKEAIQAMVRLKECMDIGSSPINQMIMQNVLDDFYDEHVKHLINTYSTRLEAMQESLDSYMPKGISWDTPKGGMFFWLELPNGSDTDTLLHQSIHQAQVAFVPGHNFNIDPSQKNYIRLSFCLYEPEVINSAMQRLGNCIEEYLHNNKPSLSSFDVG